MVKFLDNNSGFAQWNANKQAAAAPSRFGRALWWMVIFMASWWAVSLWMGPKKTPTPATDTTGPAVDISAVPVQQVGNDDIAIDVQGLRLSRVELRHFAASDQGDAARVILLDDKADFAEVGLLATGTTAPTATTQWRTQDGVMHWKNKDGVSYRRTINADGYVITITDQVTNGSQRDISVAPYARIVRTTSASRSAGVFTGAIANVNGDLERQDWHDLNKRAYAYTTTNGYVGFADQYWETILAVDAPDQTIRMKQIDAMLDAVRYQVDAAAAARQVAAGKTETIQTRLFAGPRDQQVLGAADAQIPEISRTMDYGWFWFLTRPLLWVLNTLNALVMNYGVAIILLTIALRFVLWPLTRKSYTSMMAMQKMQPEMARIQKQFANDKPRMQMEMLRLYQAHKTSPMSGCLPMLIQIPIFFALYKALFISVQMRSAHFLWISDLAAMDPYCSLPILMGATRWWQQRLQTPATAKSGGNDVAAQTQRMMRWMPLLFTIMFAWMPAGLVLYWTVSNLFGIAQMYIIKRRK